MTESFENNNRIRSIKDIKAEAKYRGHTGYSKLNRAQLTGLLNPEKLIDLPIPENNRKAPTIEQLKAEAKRRGFTRYSKLNKAQLIDLVNPLNEPKPKISVPVLTPRPVKKSIIDLFPKTEDEHFRVKEAKSALKTNLPYSTP